MSIGSVVVDGITIQIEVAGMSRVQNINGQHEVHLSVRPVFPWDNGPGGGEPLPVEDAA